MATGTDDDADLPDPMAAIRAADSLDDLLAVTGESDAHDAYFAAKRAWRDHRNRAPVVQDPAGGVPGARVVVDGVAFWVHGITHADTAAEGEYLRDRVAGFLDRGGSVYCEQGIRGMYFDSLPEVCGMDDYRWAMARCRELDLDSHVADLEGSAFAGIAEDFDSLTGRLQDTAFSLIRSGADVYGEEFGRALGDLATAFLSTHEDLATGDDFESFVATRRAAEDPTRLVDLQRYYERTFLPQPIEREWLRRHDRELEVLTHARNERMADYAVYHAETDEVHLIVGAAHQPGIRYYLEQYRDGERTLSFDPVA